MKSIRWFASFGMVLALSGANFGCMSRAISEGLGVVTGAAGKVVDIERPQSLQQYRGFKVESLTVTSGLKAPATLAVTLRDNFLKVAAKKDLTPTGKPCLLLTGEVVNYESADAVDTAIGPLEEVIVRVRLLDADTNEILAVANLIGRAKSTTAGGEERLSEGAGKALRKWLKKANVGKDDEEKDE